MTFSLRKLLVLVTTIAVLLALLIPIAKQQSLGRSLFSTQSERIQLEHALHGYQSQIGAFPPSTNSDEIQSHIETFYGGLNVNALLQGQRRIDDIDIDEHLFLWLYEMPVLAKMNGAYFFEFDSDRLVDVDSDGWLEYKSECGTTFQCLDSKVDVINPVTGKSFRR